VPYGHAVGDVAVVVFDLDGTLIDSDAALVQPFLALGVPRDEISFGHPIEVECARLGLSVADYVGAYDVNVVMPFPGVEEMLATIPRWAVCSNKARESGVAELARLGWLPEVVMFADDFGGQAKALGPVLDALEVEADRALFVGDTDHDRQAAETAGTGFAWAGWNPRVGRPDGRAPVLATPDGVTDLVRSGLA